LGKKYNISAQDMTNFISQIDLHPPIRKKTILQNHEKCGARKQDGQQCSRRHKPDETYCGKHMTNLPFGIYNGVTTNSNITSSKHKSDMKQPKNNDDTIVLKSVQIQNRYYYMDRHKILYNPEPVNGYYEIIGKLNNNDEIFTTSLITTLNV
jgi:hypothetical protein